MFEVGFVNVWEKNPIMNGSSIFEVRVYNMIGITNAQFYSMVLITQSFVTSFKLKLDPTQLVIDYHECYEKTTLRLCIIVCKHYNLFMK